MYKSNELGMHCIYVTVVLESEFGLCYWGFAQWKSLCLYIHITPLHICNSSKGFAFASAITNRSDGILNNSLEH